MDDIDKKLIPLLCQDIDDSLYPFKQIAEKLNISESLVIEKIKGYKSKGMLRRFGAILYHQHAGFSGNGMSIWNVDDNKIDEVAENISKFPMVSHCYKRPKFDIWQYNLYAMVHGKTEEECKKNVQEISEYINISDYDILFSLKEFKKSSMIYDL